MRVENWRDGEHRDFIYRQHEITVTPAGIRSGWVRTRMGGPSAPRSPADGVDTAVWLATLPFDGPTGGFYRDRHLIEW